MNTEKYQFSDDIKSVLDLVSPKDQQPNMRMFKTGYEGLINSMYKIDPGTDCEKTIAMKVGVNNFVMQHIALSLKGKSWLTDTLPGDKGFKRVTISAEGIINKNGSAQGGAEIIVGLWGKGCATPDHGHSAGYTYERVLFGRVMVNKYRMMDDGTIRIVESNIFSEGEEFSAGFFPEDPDNKIERSYNLHSVRALEPSATLHFIGERPHDGKNGNVFNVERFEDERDLNELDFKPISSLEGMYTQPGDVLLVRSANVPEYGDHFLLITGRPQCKHHGLRPQGIAFLAPGSSHILDDYKPYNGTILLKLNDQAKFCFHKFHNVTVESIAKIS